MKLKFVFSAVLLVLLVVPTSLISYISYQEKVAQNANNQAMIRRLTLSRSKDRIESYLLNILEYVRADSNIPQLSSFLSSNEQSRKAQVSEINSILRNVIVKDTLNVTSVALIDLGGINVQDIRIAQQGRDESNYPYFITQSNQLAPSMYYKSDEQHHSHSIYFSSPVRNSHGKVVGYLRLMLEVAAIQQLVNQIAKHLDYASWLTINNKDTVMADSRLRTQLQQPNQQKDYITSAQLKPLEWQVTLTQDSTVHDKEVMSYRRFLMLQMFAMLVVSLIVSLIVARIMSRPVERIKQLAIEIAHNDLDKRITGESIDEFAELAAAINAMADNLVKGYRELAQEHEQLENSQREVTELNEKLEKRVIERTQQLSAQNTALESAMQQIVQSEKLASLGKLVSGVSHELNTPIGVALTAGSFALDIHDKIVSELEQKTLSFSSLSDHLVSLKKAVKLVENNCYKASELVANFKQITGDHITNERRKFNLQKTVDAVLSTLKAKLSVNHYVEIDGFTEIELDSFPGAFEQVLIHLITNSIVHGFAELEHGKISIGAQSLSDQYILVRFKDNGSGINVADRDKVFDPFFTTRLGEGSSGLGLYIVFNLVTGILGGEIKLCNTRVEDGVEFEIKLPIVAPVVKN